MEALDLRPGSRFRQSFWSYFFLFCDFQKSLSKHLNFDYLSLLQIYVTIFRQASSDQTCKFP